MTTARRTIARGAPAHRSALREQQVRVGPFNGANSLGLLTDLAALRIVASRTFGPVGSRPVWVLCTTGAGVRNRRSCGPAESTSLFRALKIYAEALGRGWPAYAKTTDDGITPVLACTAFSRRVDAIANKVCSGLGSVSGRKRGSISESRCSSGWEVSHHPRC